MLRLSGFHSFTQSTVQGSGIGPSLWIIMESDLRPLSAVNVLVKYADDTNLLVSMCPWPTSMRRSKFGLLKLCKDKS